MLKPRKRIDLASSAARLDRVQAAVRREAASAEADPFDKPMLAAAAGTGEALTAEAGALTALQGRLGKLARTPT